MFNGLDHIAIVVPDASEALKLWRDQLGFLEIARETVNNGSTLLVHLDLGNIQLQLVQPLNPDHTLTGWLKEHGPGLHHICFTVEDVDGAGEELAALGIPPGEPRPHQGVGGKRALFLDQAGTRNVLIELTGR